VVKTVGDEVLVYDLVRHRAHSLNRAALAVWRRLDGRTAVGEVARRLHEDLDGLADEGTVWLALRELDRAELLETPLPRPAGLSRRQWLRRAGVAAGASAGLVPAVTTILVPAASAQASPQTSGCAGTSCSTGTCPGGSGNCRCVGTPESRVPVCVEPCCVSGTTGCTSSADCAPGQVCSGACCGGQSFCVPLCGEPAPPPGGACATIISE
jgi:hypothetical protein